MKSDWEYEYLRVIQRKCPKCHGRGICDDAEPGDMSFREWTCPECKGTGVNNRLPLEAREKQ